MKKIGRFIANILIVVYAIIAIAVTILLLSYNDYQMSVIGGYTFILVTDDELEDDGYPNGSLVLVKETKAKNIDKGDYVFLYRNISTTQFEVKYAQVLEKDDSAGEYAVQYILEGNSIIDHEDVIGSTKNIKVIPHLGTILSILQSRYGYLFLIVVVSFIAFLYEIYELIMEIKYGEREEDEEDYDDDEYEEEKVVVKPRKTTTKKKTEATTPRKTSSTTKTTGTGSKTTTTRKNTSTAKTTTAKKTSAKKTSATDKAPTSKSTTSTKKTTSKGTEAKGTTAKTGTAKKTTKSK